MTEQNAVNHELGNTGPCPLEAFNEMEKDTLKEIGNISLGSSATALSLLTSHRVNITTPTLSYVTVDEINGAFQAPCILVEVEYIEGLIGRNLLIIDTKDAVIIGQLMMMEEPNPESEMNEIHLSAVSEAMNMMMGAAATAMSDMFQRMINISSPKVEYKKLDEDKEKKIMPGSGGFIQIAFKVEVPGLIDSELLQLVPLDFARQMVDYLLQQAAGPCPLDDFNEMERDTLKEVGNISLGSSATSLSQLMSHQVNITTPTLSYVTVAEINERFKAPCILVDVEYIEGLIGSNLLIIDTKDAVIIGQLMMMEEPNPESEITEIHLSAVSEAMNMMMGAAATAMSDMFQRMINISSPKVEHKKIEDAIEKEKILKGDGGFIQVAFRVEVAGLIDSELLQLMPLDFARQTVDFLLNQCNDEADLLKGAGLQEAAPKAPEKNTATLQQLKKSQDSDPVTFAADELNLVKNISLEVKGIVGRLKMPLERVLQLGKGSVVELDTYVGDEVEILINGKSVATAEIVAIDNQYGLKLRKILKI